jgi:hypothetical protein
MGGNDKAEALGGTDLDGSGDRQASAQLLLKPGQLAGIGYL